MCESAQCSDTGFGHLGVLVSFDTGNTHGTHYLTTNNHRHAAFQRGHKRRGQEGRTTAIDHVFKTLGFTATEGGTAGFFSGNVGTDRRTTVETLEAQWVAAVIDHADAHRPLVFLGFGTGASKNAADFGLAQYGFGLHNYFHKYLWMRH
ncbi:hypothetical protein A5N81_00830 [Pseudomonas aeruginosa]|nr:hypothetical protein A5N81_00830 [Pseudomonas aeruginosa]